MAQVAGITRFFLLSVFLFSANITAQTLYIDEDNIVTIKVPCVQSSELTATAEGGTLTRKSEEEWIARPSGESDFFIVTVSTNKNGKTKVLASKTYDVLTVNPDIMPQFPGGQQAMINFIAANLKYPAVALENGIQGTVYVSFIVERDGSLSNVKAERSPHDLLSKEAIRVIDYFLMPNWTPGQYKGRFVRVPFTVPIVFILG